MASTLHRLNGHDGSALEVGYSLGTGYYVGLYKHEIGDQEKIGLDLYELLEFTAPYVDWSELRTTFLSLLAAPVRLRAHDTPSEPAARVVKAFLG